MVWWYESGTQTVLTGYAWYWWYESGTQNVLTGYAWYWWYESGTQTVLTHAPPEHSSIRMWCFQELETQRRFAG